MNKEQFISQEIEKLKKIMYGEDNLMTEDEEKKFREFFSEFIKDLKEISKSIKK